MKNACKSLVTITIEICCGNYSDRLKKPPAHKIDLNHIALKLITKKNWAKVTKIEHGLHTFHTLKAYETGLRSKPKVENEQATCEG